MCIGHRNHLPAAVVLLLLAHGGAAGGAATQEAEPAFPILPPAAAYPQAAPSPGPEGLHPAGMPSRSWQYQTPNQPGAATNLHEWSRSDDGTWYRSQHSGTQPHGGHAQLHQYQQTEDGYSFLREQRFFRPDGTLHHEHSMSVHGTDPNNVQRQMNHTLPDGRTMEQTFTRSYDGQSGTMERSFVGPNGQVQHFARPWTPDGPAGSETGPAPSAAASRDRDPGRPHSPHFAPSANEPGPVSAGRSAAPLAAEGGKLPAERGFWSRINPFRKSESTPTGGASASRRSGFTVGSFGSSRGAESMPPGLARRPSGEPSLKSMQNMKPTRPIGPPAHAMGADRGNPSRMPK